MSRECTYCFENDGMASRPQGRPIYLGGTSMRTDARERYVGINRSFLVCGSLAAAHDLP